jgi:hypothetical protein
MQYAVITCNRWFRDEITDMYPGYFPGRQQGSSK